MSFELENKVKRFNAQYEVVLDWDAIEEGARIDGVFNDFTFDKKDQKEQARMTYYDTLEKMLMKSLNAQTQIGLGGDYDLSYFDFVKFVRAFEDIAQQRNAESSNPRERKAYEGMSFNKILEKLQAKSKAYDKPVYSIWADKIIAGEISYEHLKDYTKEAIRTIESSKDKAVAFHRGAISNVLFAHEAMLQVRKSRGGWWKAFHLIQNYREKKYLEALTEQKNVYISRNYPVADILRETPASMMEKAYENTKHTLKREAMHAIDKKVKAKIEEDEKKRREISSVAEKLSDVVKDFTTSAKITDEIVKNLPESKWKKTTLKSILSPTSTNMLINEAQKANAVFDQLVAGGEDPQKMMVNNVREVFKKAYFLTSALGYTDVKDQILAAQAMTDVMMKNISPAALEPDKYKDFVNGYVLKHPKDFDGDIDIDVTEPAFVNAQNEYNEKNREIVKINDFQMQTNTEIVPPVQEVPSNDAPNLKGPSIDNN